MYIPRINTMPDDTEVVSFMQQYSFATVISIYQEVPIATHIPLIIEKENDALKIIGHFAKANPQWQSLENQKVLIIFAEPHAYISPTHYESKINVPTWNYIAVHAYGECTLLPDHDHAMTILEKTINAFEPDYKTQWDTLPQDYKMANLEAIMSFEMKVTELQAKKKLSQNKTDVERNNIIHQLENSEDSNEKVIGEWMKKEV